MILLELQQEKTILKLKSIDSQFDAIFDERWLKKKNEDLDVILVLRQAYKEVATFGNKFEDVDAQLRLDDNFYKIVKQIAVLENRKLLPPLIKTDFHMIFITILLSKNFQYWKHIIPQVLR